jgi:outer membrane receptor for ferric coprogen and ferric-rhodotorulic acid
MALPRITAHPVSSRQPYLLRHLPLAHNPPV